jgi:hypothetical protein
MQQRHFDAAVMMCGLVIFLPIAALITAVMVRAACSFFNKLAGADRAVPEPSFPKALGIAVVGMVTNVVVSTLLGLVLGVAGHAAQLNAGPTELIANLISIPVSFFVLGGILTVMLPTSFQRGLLVALIYCGIAIAIGLIVGIVVFVVALALGIGFGAAGR